MSQRSKLPPLALVGIVAALALSVPAPRPESARPAVPSKPGKPAQPAPVAKPVLYLFTLPVCPYCDRIKQSLADPRVKPLLDRFDFREADASGPEAAKYHVNLAPTLVIVGSGKPDVKVGYQTAEQLHSWLSVRRTARPRRPSPSSKIVEAGAEGPDGRHVMIDYPAEIWKANITSRGQGCCVQRSVDLAAHWQSVPVLYDFPEWIKSKGIPGGAYPEELARRIGLICKDRHSDEPDYVNVETKDFGLLKLVIATGRMPCVDYSGNDGVHYDGPIAHCVCLSYVDDDYVCVLDNNFPPDKSLWMPTADFKARWGGWIIALCAPRPPAPPHN